MFKMNKHLDGNIKIGKISSVEAKKKKMQRRWRRKKGVSKKIYNGRQK